MQQYQEVSLVTVGLTKIHNYYREVKCPACYNQSQTDIPVYLGMSKAKDKTGDTPRLEEAWCCQTSETATAPPNGNIQPTVS